MPTHRSLAGAYAQGLRALLAFGDSVPSVTDPTSPASSFGKADRPAIELLGYRFEVSNPNPTILFAPQSAATTLSYAIGLLMWSLAGSDDVEWLEYYNPSARRYSDDGLHLSGAFGKRLFAFPDSIRQIDRVCKLLSEDPHTRRATALILSPSDNRHATREYPCAIGLHFFLRKARLSCVSYMRAQQALTVLPLDALLFISILHLVAEKVGAQVGRYIHFSGTFHIYQSEKDSAAEIASGHCHSLSLGPFVDVANNLPRILSLEARLRSAVASNAIDCVIGSYHASGYPPGSFFDNAANLLLALAIRKLNGTLPRRIRQPPIRRPIMKAMQLILAP